MTTLSIDVDLEKQAEATFDLQVRTYHLALPGQRTTHPNPVYWSPRSRLLLDPDGPLQAWIATHEERYVSHGRLRVPKDQIARDMLHADLRRDFPSERDRQAVCALLSVKGVQWIQTEEMDTFTVIITKQSRWAPVEREITSFLSRRMNGAIVRYRYRLL